jgi:hypothetical protein
MPQATEEQRHKWGGMGGVGDDKASRFLQDRGFKLTDDWQWAYRTGQEFTDQDFEAAQFLCDEWDYGWFVLIKEYAE